MKSFVVMIKRVQRVKEQPSAPMTHHHLLLCNLGLQEKGKETQEKEGGGDQDGYEGRFFSIPFPTFVKTFLKT